MWYRIGFTGISLLLAVVLSACHGPRIPLANTQAPAEQTLRQVGIDLEGIPENHFELECEKEEDPCRHKHIANLFLGYSRAGDEYGATFGLEYLYRIKEDVSIGAFVDVAAGDLREGAYGAGVFFRPTENTFFMIAPGVHVSTHGEDKLLLRLGTGYEYEVGRSWIVGPALYLDLIDGMDPVFVFGLNIGRTWR